VVRHPCTDFRTGIIFPSFGDTIIAAMSHDPMEIARQHRQAGRFAQAGQIYRQILTGNPDDPDALHALGSLAEQAGQADAAIDLIGRAIRLRPANASFHNDLGKALIRKGRRDEASKCFQRAVELDPNDAEAHSNLGNTLSDKSGFEAAIAAYRRAIELRPDYVEAHYNMGNSLRRQGRWQEAIDAYRRAIELRPELAEAHNNLGNVLMDNSRYQEAVAAFKNVVELRPRQAMGYNNLAGALRKTGQIDAALDALDKAIALQADYATAYNNRGVILKDRGRHEEALASFRKAVALKPDFADALHDLVTLLKELGRHQEAIALCRQAITNQPNFAAGYNILGGMLQELGRVDEALAMCTRALAIKPELPEGHNNLGNVYRDQGRLDKAIESYRRALELKPDSFSIGSNLAFTVQFSADYDAPAILAENRKWAERHESPLLAEHRPHANDRTPDRILRIGYVSPYFRVHSAAFFLMPVLAHHNPANVQVFCYCGARQSDHVTEQFRQLKHTWRDTVGMSDTELADQIRQDNIDILIDIALHMQDSRLLMFARKPAPVQVTWLGYPGTTGLTSIDYRLTDPYLDPPGHGDELYSEQSVRLPHTFWCYRPLIQTPEVNPLPALQSGHITFGCFNNFHKVTPQTLQLWTATLAAVPGSRLIILSPAGSHRDAVRQTFATGGVAPDRIDFVPRLNLEDYFRLYHQVDICLDTIPYPGHTTTLDSLWMAVPVITLPGNTAVSRGGASILTNLNLGNLIAKTPAEYISLVSQTAADLPALARLRSELRGRMQSSAMMNARQFVDDMEAAYRRMWMAYCASEQLPHVR
jgi:predicted O-linked N-acetylglucosamine transferase (SPINDLY family)